MEMEPQERDSDIGDDSPVSHHDEELSEIDSGGNQEDVDSGDEIRRHNSMLADHGDVLAKLKMQVRDIKVGEDFENRHLPFPMTNRPNEGFQLPVPFPFPHPAAFLPPLAPQQQAPSSGSSHSSEGSASSQHTWSFEEQFKQVRQLYEINDDPKRKEFLDELFSFMQKRGTPINRLPIMAKSVLDLYELYNLVIARGGLVDVINKKLWQEIIKGLHLPSSITSAAFTLRTQYMKYLYPYECDKRRLSTPAELQAAIDGNRREGRRSSYGQYEHQRSPNPSQMSPLSLVSQQHQHIAARINSAMSGGIGLHNGALHHQSHPPAMDQPTHVPTEFEIRMMEYVKLLNKEINHVETTPPPMPLPLPPPPTIIVDPQADGEKPRNWYNNNDPEPQKEALNLSDSSPPMVKREHPDHSDSPPIPNKFMRDGGPSRTRPTGSNSSHIKINSRGDSRNGDNTLVVSMELNGVTYQGVLFPQTGNTSIA